jgi:hypothetical protein
MSFTGAPCLISDLISNLISDLIRPFGSAPGAGAPPYRRGPGESHRRPDDQRAGQRPDRVGGGLGGLADGRHLDRGRPWGGGEVQCGGAAVGGGGVGPGDHTGRAGGQDGERQGKEGETGQQAVFHDR